MPATGSPAFVGGSDRCRTASVPAYLPTTHTPSNCTVSIFRLLSLEPSHMHPPPTGFLAPTEGPHPQRRIRHYRAPFAQFTIVSSGVTNVRRSGARTVIS